MMNLNDYRANSLNFHELTKIIFVDLVSMDFFITLVFRVKRTAEQLYLSQMMCNFKTAGL